MDTEPDAAPRDEGDRRPGEPGQRPPEPTAVDVEGGDHRNEAPRCGGSQHVTAGVRESRAGHEPRTGWSGPSDQVLEQPLDGRPRRDRDQHDQRQCAAPAGCEGDADRAGCEDDRRRAEPGDPEGDPVDQRAPQRNAGVGDGPVPDQQRTLTHAGERSEQASQEQRRRHEPRPSLTDPAKGCRWCPVQVRSRSRLGPGSGRCARGIGRANRCRGGGGGGAWRHGVPCDPGNRAFHRHAERRLNVPPR